MGFQALLGNDRVKQNLSQSLARGHISHFYLISGPRGSGKRTLAGLLAAAILCRSGDRPCGKCGVCRRVLANEHPDFISVTDPERKYVPVKLVKSYREDMFVLPNESDHKLYLFPQELRVEGQNALLKVLEEPPSYGVFILLTENPDSILPTVRSRCTELKLEPLSPALLRRTLEAEFLQAPAEDIRAAMARSGGFLGPARELLASGEGLPPQTERFAEGFANRDALLLTQTLAPMEKLKREALAELLTSWLELISQALACRSGSPAATALARSLAASRSSAELHRAALALKRGIELVSVNNVSPGAVCGWLVWELR